jgi:RimJ/RimL family protein N-acetyltransferase
MAIEMTYTSSGIRLETEHLILRSTTPDMIDDYAALYADSEVMKSLGEGDTKTREYVQSQLEMWNKRWMTGSYYSGMAVFEKKTKKFIGHFVVGYNGDPGQAVIMYLFHKEFWGNGYAKETARAVIWGLIPKIYDREILQGKYPLGGKPLTTLYACARTDNVASNAILQGIGMKFFKTEEKFGAMRHHYTYNIRYMNPNNPMIPALKKPLAECSMKELVQLLKK